MSRTAAVGFFAGLVGAAVGAVAALDDFARQFDSSSSVRRSWVLASEEEVLRRFGTPDRLEGDDDEDRWHYWKIVAGSITHEYVFLMKHAHVLAFHHKPVSGSRPAPGNLR